MGSGIRECFRARDGHVWVTADYSSLELATLAQACLWLVGGSAMADAINAKRDLNTQLGAQMAGLKYEEMVARIKAGDDLAKGMRQAAKAANYGFGGGLGPATLVKTQRKVGLSLCTSMGRSLKCSEYKVTEYKGRSLSPTCLECLGAGEALKKQWLEAWPEMTAYLKIAARVEDNGGSVEQLVSKRVRGGCTYCSAANTLFQGLAADGAKRALWLVTRACHVDPASPLYNSRPVAFIHDEIITETPEERGHEALQELRALMVAGMREYTPDVLIRAEGATMRSWFKGAEAAYRDGRVVPSKPVVIDGKTKWVEDTHD